MKYLLPILASVATFFAVRHFRPNPELQDSPEQTAQRAELKGLARRVDRLGALESTSVAELEKLRRSGRATLQDLMWLLEQPGDGFEATWDWIEQAGYNESDRNLLRTALVSKWFDHDPDACLARIGACNYMDGSELAGRLLGRLFKGTPEQAEGVRKHLGLLVSLVGAVDSSLELPPGSPESAKTLLSLPEGAPRNTLLRFFAKSWLESDPAAAIAWLQQVPPEISTSALESFAEQMLNPYSTPTEAQRKLAADWLTTKAPKASLARLGPDLVASMAKSDPAGALAWAHKNLSAAPLAEATGKAIQQVLAKDSGEARRMVEELPPGNLRHLAAYKVAEAYLAENPADAVAWWLDQVDAKEKSIRGSFGAPERLGMKWSETQPDSFRARVANSSLPKLPESVLFSGINQLMKQDRAATFEWISSMSAKQRPELARAAYRSWSYDSPAEAAASFDSRPDLATGETAGQIASSWYSKDPQAALGWIANLPWGGPREAAMAKVKEIADFEVSLGGTFPEDLKKLLH